jgi:hypothetical protein
MAAKHVSEIENVTKASFYHPIISTHVIPQDKVMVDLMEVVTMMINITIINGITCISISIDKLKQWAFIHHIILNAKPIIVGATTILVGTNPNMFGTNLIIVTTNPNIVHINNICKGYTHRSGECKAHDGYKPHKCGYKIHSGGYNTCYVGYTSHYMGYKAHFVGYESHYVV